MKKLILSVVLLYHITYGQDVLITNDGKELPGEYINHDRGLISFLYEGQNDPTTIPIKNIKGVRLSSGEMLDTSLPTVIKAKIYFVDGDVLDGELKNFTATESKKIVSLKKKWGSTYINYELSEINFIKSWNGKILYPYGVAGNKISNKYHLPNVRHLPEKSDQQFFQSEKDAQNENFSPCLACFDNAPMLSDYDLEKSLVRATIISFQNNNEIIYEHPELSTLSATVDKILSNWPETLKGYKYRIQIYRDDNPNAMAIGGGNLYVSTGLLEMIEDSLELESVIAHEIGHVERRHTLRQFYDSQKKIAGSVLATIIVGLGVAASGGDTQDVGAVTAITAAVSKYAMDLAIKGYSQELEQEADIMAQLYFNGTNKPTKPMLSLLDKLATFSVSRLGYLDEGIKAFSDHPSLLERINQVEKSVMHNFDIPFTFSAIPLASSNLYPGFFQIKIHHILRSPSSVSDKEKLCILIGTIENNHPELNFKIDEFSLQLEQKSEEKIEKQMTYIITKDGKDLPGQYISHDEQNVVFIFEGKIESSTIPLANINGIRLANGQMLDTDLVSVDPKSLKGGLVLEGLKDQIINYDSIREFMGVIRTSTSREMLVFSSLKKKELVINSIGLSPVVLERGEEAKSATGYKKINSKMIVK